ncbi:hypothetical protein Sphch_0446 [Sphingobium chlorophenolicum L-1]|uniref:DUF2783 domain-containing protein n=1 Tax=Sphingobium chlorophenolicum L-1 TaxID=690566 RepID=F6EWY0_SPHCR|nr:DUF2783 domain-containing protein [Sphingobium chlorophenolicum]AEG48143.1 hypothetical protein Sphch_0446 [Sphingobium chlorophenolicum L-1]
MGDLNLDANIAHPDDLYDRLIVLHDGLDDRQSAIVNSKLILLLANHIGDEQVIRQAIGLARGALTDVKSPVPLDADLG